MGIDEKWDEVKAFYERSYKVTFERRLKDREILELHKKMRQLQKEIYEYFQKDPKPSL